MNSQKFAGLFIPNHRVTDAESKERAINTLSGWQLDCLTAEDWIAKLDSGQTIQPSAFSPKPDGTFTHAKEYWNSTHFVCADADNIKGVEFLDDGVDKNPDGVEMWTEQDGLSKRFPELKPKVYAVGQSVSSMLKEPLHRRYRLIFLFDKPIATEEHYYQILLKLATEFPIIPAVERSPAQPVFGNARDGFDFHICGHVLSLDDYPYTPPAEAVNQSQERLKLDDDKPDETLEEYLRRYGIAYTLSDKESGKYFVECPYKDTHTGGVNKPKDAYVMDSSNGYKWSFYAVMSIVREQIETTGTLSKEGMGLSISLTRRTITGKNSRQQTVVTRPQRRTRQLLTRFQLTKITGYLISLTMRVNCFRAVFKTYIKPTLILTFGVLRW